MVVSRFNYILQHYTVSVKISVFLRRTLNIDRLTTQHNNKCTKFVRITIYLNYTCFGPH